MLGNVRRWGAGVVLAGACLAVAPSCRAAGIEKGSVGVGLNYPGIGLRYFITDSLCAEARSQYEQDTFFGGARACWYFRRVTGVFPYLGGEAGYADYKGSAAEAGGYAVALFAGGEYFMWPKVSAQFDFGPAYVGLEDGDMSISVGGIEFVINFGLTYYLGRR